MGETRQIACISILLRVLSSKFMKSQYQFSTKAILSILFQHDKTAKFVDPWSMVRDPYGSNWLPFRRSQLEEKMGRKFIQAIKLKNVFNQAMQALTNPLQLLPETLV
jgi:hypothetical protein